jgi:hypothetical protein
MDNMGIFHFIHEKNIRIFRSFRCSASLRRTPERLLVETSIASDPSCQGVPGVSDGKNGRFNQNKHGELRWKIKIQ